MRTALVTCGGGLQGMSVIEALRRVPQVRVIVMDNTADNLGRYFSERFVLAPPVRDEAEFIDAVLTTCREESVDILLPATEHELGALARHADRIRATGTRVLCSTEAVLRVSSDKLEQYRWLLANGLPSLLTSTRPDEEGLTLPILGKLRRGWGGKGQRVLATADDLADAQARGEQELVWQPKLAEFDEYSIDFAIDEAGRSTTPAIRRRSRTLAGFALIGDPVDDPSLSDIAARTVDALARLGGIGLFNVQVLSSGGRYWVSDLNSRAGTSLPLSLATGHNPVAFLLRGTDDGERRMARSIRVMRERVVEPVPAISIAGLVFDLDDTLLDQKDWIARKLEGTWEARRDRLPARSTFLRTAYQLLEEAHRADLLDAVCLQLGLDDAARIDLIEVYRGFQPAGCRLYDDVEPVLAELRRRGFRLGVLTDNPPASQRMKIRVAGLAAWVDAIVLTGELGQRKPAPVCFQAASRALGIDPQSLAMVGDHPYRDGLGALQAGYALSFSIHRPGAMFDFSTPRLAAEVKDARAVVVESLTELFWYLPEVAP